MTANEIPDGALRAGLAVGLGKPAAQITRTDLQSELLHLDISKKGVRRLAGLHLASRLRSLRANQNPLTSTVAIAEMPALERLELDDCELFTLRVDDMPMLKTLYARNNLIEDVRDLRHAPRLSELHLDGNPIDDNVANDIGSLFNLNIISLNNTAVTDVSAFRRLARIEHVYLRHTYVHDLTVFATMPSLRTLDIRNTYVTDLAPLVANPRLGDGDRILANGLALNEESICTHIPALRNRGVIIEHERECAGATIVNTAAPGQTGTATLSRIGSANELYVDFDYTGISDGSRLRPLNLLSAAAQYLEPGGTIRLIAGASNEYVILSEPMILVSENGVARGGNKKP